MALIILFVKLYGKKNMHAQILLLTCTCRLSLHTHVSYSTEVFNVKWKQLIWFSARVLFLFLYLHINFRAHTPGINSANSEVLFARLWRVPVKLCTSACTHMRVFTVGDWYLCTLDFSDVLHSSRRLDITGGGEYTRKLKRKQKRKSILLMQIVFFPPSSFWWIYLWTKENK